MSKAEMKDMLILLPGIMGSVLQRGGADLWAVSGQSIFGFIRSFGSSLDHLTLSGEDDPTLDDLGDQITATALIPDAHLIPGLWKIDGYSGIAQMIKNNFTVTAGRADDPGPANYYEFPYDWRRDNRVAARRLRDLIDRQLPVWRTYRRAPDAKVIILAHSMGGLVARHYLEVMEGWPNCRLLVTFGTPYRGSVKALNYLANGYKNVLVDLTEAVRSFTSVYQLLPIYPVVKVGGNYQRVAELDDIPHVDRQRAAQARQFHLDIIEKVTAHKKDSGGDYARGFQLVPVVGIQQPTLQSGEVMMDGARTGLVADDTLPGGKGYLDAGDGTVPYTSAIPYEFSEEYRECTFVEQHGALQNNERVLDYLSNLLRRTQAGSLLEALGPEKETSGIRLTVHDLYLPDEQVEIRAEIVNAGDGPVEWPDTLEATITPSQGGGLSIQSDLIFDGQSWVLVQEGLPAGVYRVEVKPRGPGEGTINPVHGLFEVWDAV